jgi:hypothetical protein
MSPANDLSAQRLLELFKDVLPADVIKDLREQDLDADDMRMALWAACENEPDVKAEVVFKKKGITE